MPILTSHQRLTRRRTKILATLGPSSTSVKTLGKMVRAGVDIFRLNMSHGDHAGHEELYRKVRRVAEAEKRTVGILPDLAGPKIRTGTFRAGAITLAAGEDREDARFASELGVDFLALSFVQQAEDVRPRGGGEPRSRTESRDEQEAGQGLGTGAAGRLHSGGSGVPLRPGTEHPYHCRMPDPGVNGTGNATKNQTPGWTVLDSRRATPRHAMRPTGMPWMK